MFGKNQKNIFLKILTATLAALLMFTLVSCGDSGDEGTGDEITGRSVTGRAGTYEVPASVGKVVSLSDAATDILVGIGAADKIIAADTVSAKIDGVASGITTFNASSPDTAAVIALAPDLVIVNSADESAAAAIKDAGICVAAILPPTSVQDINNDIRFVANLVNMKNAGDTMSEGVNKTMNAMYGAVSGMPWSGATVLFELSESSGNIATVGSDTYISDIISTLGFKNIFADASGEISVSLADAAAANPDYIITVSSTSAKITAREGWAEVPAVKSNRIVEIDADNLLRPSQNIALTVQEVFDALGKLS